MRAACRPYILPRNELCYNPYGVIMGSSQVLQAWQRSMASLALSVVSLAVCLSFSRADPSEFQPMWSHRAQGFVNSSLIPLSGDVFVLALRNYAPIPEGNSSLAAQFQVSQFVWQASHSTCRSLPYIMLSVHLDFARVAMLVDLVEGFMGCVSAAVLIKSDNEMTGLIQAFRSNKVRGTQNLIL